MATIKDVAERAGVSISTVSYALSGKRPIGKATRERVEAAVRELDFRPKAGAKMLASTKADIIALSAPMHEATEPFAFMMFVLAIVTAARRKGYDVMLLTQSGEEAVRDIERVVSTGLVDGVLAMDVQAIDERIAPIRDLKVPSVFLGLPDDTDSLACVDLDFEAATRMTIDRLVDAGHSSIAFVGHKQMLYEMTKNFAVRTRSEFERYSKELGLETAFISSEVSNMNEEIRATLPGCTAVILDCSAASAQAFLKETGALTVDQLPFSIISLASSYDTESMTPALDTVPLEPDLSGQMAVEMLVQRIERDIDPSVHLYAPRYIERGSVFVLGGGDR